jgi:hypothetical protein
VFESPCGAVPELDGAVGGAGGDVAAVGREAEYGDGFLVAAEDEGGFVV